VTPRATKILSLDRSPEEPRVYTVSQIADAIQIALEEGIGPVIVQGEIAALSRPASGHVYFTLKDEGAQIKSALFAGYARSVKFDLQIGMAVQVEGKVSAYKARSEYQLIATRVSPIGYGALQAQFEALKRKLQLEGLFATDRKRPLPEYPTRIGLVTSATGAALRDMLRVLKARAPYLSITVADTRVQGDGAAEEIADAIRRMNEWGQADVLVVGRGGGSAQDLWAFNEEAVVRAIAASAIPVVSAVGHEVDFTLADLAADLRAATPTHAAQIVVKDIEEIRGKLGEVSRHARKRILLELEALRRHLAWIAHHHALKQPERKVHDGLQTLDRYQERLARGLQGWVTERRGRLEMLAAGIRAHAPSRSFARALDRLESIRRRANRSLAMEIERRGGQIEAQARLLDSFNHRRVLERGYALVWTEGRGALRMRGLALSPQEPIEIQFYDASARARVTQIVSEGEEGTS